MLHSHCAASVRAVATIGTRTQCERSTALFGSRYCDSILTEQSSIWEEEMPILLVLLLLLLLLYYYCTVVRTLVFDRRIFSVPRSTCSWRETTYVGKPSAIGQPARPTQPFILPMSINWVVSYIGCVPPRSGGAIRLRSEVMMVVWVAGKNCVIPLTRAIL